MSKRPRPPPTRLQFFVLPRNVSEILFQKGDLVHLPSLGLARFDAYNELTADDKHEAGSSSSSSHPQTAWINPLDHNGERQQTACHRLIPVVKCPTHFEPGTMILPIQVLVVYDTYAFRRMAVSQILQSDLGAHHVLEIGTSTGETSQILWNSADVTSWVGLDTSSSMIAAVQQKQSKWQHRGRPKLHSERLDALVDPERAKRVACHFHSEGPTDVWLDIGGDRSEEAVWRLLHFLCVGRPFPKLRQIVVKCEQVHQVLTQEMVQRPTQGDSFRLLSQLRFERDDVWLQDKVQSFQGTWVAASSMQKLPKHPLKAPLRLSPRDGKTPICRFHNYHRDGCARHAKNECPYDHTHCHLCLQNGHVARDCPNILEKSSGSGGGDGSTISQSPNLETRPNQQTNQFLHPSFGVYGKCIPVGERYEKLGRLGEGTYGVVYKARDRETKTIVALKRCIPHHEASDGFPVTTLREMQSLKVCKGHPNIVQLEEIAVSRNGVFLVLEYCEHDMANLIDLHFGMHKRSPFSLAASKTLVRHLLEALNHIHSHYLIHRDVKLTNLLYSNRGYLKLADFGLSRPYAAHDNRLLTQNVASLWYRPPELLLGSKRYGQSIDIWAVGCVFAEFLAGQPLINGKTEEEQFRLMVDCIGIPNTRDWPELTRMPRISSGSFPIPHKSRRTVLDTFADLSKAGLQLQSRLLHYDSYQRWTAAECLESSFFRESPAPLRPDAMPSFPTL